jgi:hypothetical protein
LAHGLLYISLVSIAASLARWGGVRFVRRFGRSIPFIGAAVALMTIGFAVRRKGLAGGALDTALNAVPFVGGLKNVAEVVRGRDFIPDRPEQ